MSIVNHVYPYYASYTHLVIYLDFEWKEQSPTDRCVISSVPFISLIEEPRALAFHARDDALAPLETTPEALLRGWRERAQLFPMFNFGDALCSLHFCINLELSLAGQKLNMILISTCFKEKASKQTHETSGFQNSGSNLAYAAPPDMPRSNGFVCPFLSILCHWSRACVRKAQLGRQWVFVPNTRCLTLLCSISMHLHAHAEHHTSYTIECKWLLLPSPGALQFCWDILCSHSSFFVESRPFCWIPIEQTIGWVSLWVLIHA